MGKRTSESLGKTHAEITADRSALTRYQQVIVGRRSFTGLLYFEFCRWLAVIPGAIGLALRKAFWPRLFASCGKGVMFGSNVGLMHPHRIHIGPHTVIGDNCVLDARNPASTEVIQLGEEAMLSHGVIISCKNGSVEVGDRCGVGAYTIIQALGQANPVSIAADTVIGPRTYITGGGNYNIERLDIPIAQQGARDMGGTYIAEGVWLGAGVCVQGGVEISRGAVVGTGAVVTKAVPEFAICGGVPAKVLRMRGE